MNKTNPLFLIALQGEHHPDILKVITQIYSQHPVKILEIHHQDIYHNICMYSLLEIFDPETESALQEDIQNMAKRYQLHAAFYPDVSLVDEKHTKQYILTMLSQSFSSEALSSLFTYLNEKQLIISGIRPLDYQNLHVFEVKIHADHPINRQNFLAGLLDFKTHYQLDLALQPDTLLRRNKRLIVFDADMTFIQCEIINELSELAGKKKEVEAITHRAMNGELDFEQALRQRVAMLEGISLSDIHKIRENIPYTPGVDRLVKVLKMLGYKIAIVSGGFSIIIQHIQQRFQLDYGFANTLEIKNGYLTGKLLNEIVDAKRKATLLKEIALVEDITPEQIIAVGDGANDLDMLACSGLGIAFNAKRFLQERATGSLSQPNLDALLYFLGISRQELESLNF